MSHRERERNSCGGLAGVGVFHGAACLAMVAWAVFGVQASAQVSILYAPTESDDPTYRADIAAITGGVVDYYDARSGTPAVIDMQQYDCVYTWVNGSYADNVAFGDNLADFVDSGGVAILGVFSSFTNGNFLSGDIMAPGYSPVVAPGGSNHFSSSSYAGDGTTAIHAGVGAYECTYRDILSLQGDGVQDGSYLDGEIAHAYRPDFKVIYSNGAGASALSCSGDWPRLIANACQHGALCGNGVVDALEECDDGNNEDGDCCTARCEMPTGCDTNVGKALFFSKEKVGKEKMVAKLLKGPAITQSELGNPLAALGTFYNLCVWDDSANLVGIYEIDRAGDQCTGGSADCWAPVGAAPPDGKGYKFKDNDGASDGIQKAIFKGGDAGKSKALWKGKGSNLPAVAAALQSTTSVTLQMHGSDASVCLETTLTDIKKADADFFKVK